jgi:small GTP-binding protein
MVYRTREVVERDCAGDLLDEVIARMPSSPLSDEYIPNYGLDQDLTAVGDQKTPRVALVGRPNVGKSTLFNRLVGEDRAVVHDMPGTTRDSIDTLVETEDGPVIFVDTAGMRRRSRIDDSAEYYSLVRALRAVDGSDIALFVIDATQGITAQDQRLAERIDAAGCPIVIMLNKWELIEDAEVGWALQPPFAPQVVKIVQTLVSDSRLRVELGERCHAYAQKNLNWEIDSQRFLTYLKEVANEGLKKS